MGNPAEDRGVNNLNSIFSLYSIFYHDSPLATSTQKPEEKGSLDIVHPSHPPRVDTRLNGRGEWN